MDPTPMPPEEEGAAAGTVGIVPFLVGFAVLAAIAAFFYFRGKSSEPDLLDFIASQQYNVELPPEAEEYDQAKAACGGDRIKLKQALMKRCVADVPMLTFMQGEEKSVQRMYHNSMIGAAAYSSFQTAMEMVKDEMEFCKGEAEEIEEGWGESVWQQAMHLHHFLTARQKQREDAKRQEEAALEKEREDKLAEKKALKKQKKDEQTALKLAEQTAEELMREAENEASSKDGPRQRKGKSSRKPR